MLTSRNLPCPCTPRFPFQHFTSGTFHTLFQLMAEHPATRAPHHALSLPSVPRPTPWSLYAELSRHLMSPQTRLTWRLLGPPPWCTSPPRSGPGPASWGLCCTRGGCGPEGRKRQGVRPCHQSGPCWCQLDKRAFFTGSPDTFRKKVPLSQGGHMRSPNHPLPAGIGNWGTVLHPPTASRLPTARGLSSPYLWPVELQI